MTKKIPAVLSLVLLAALTASAQAPADWVKFSPPGSPFTVLMPVEPKGQPKSTGENNNGPYTTTVYMSTSSDRELYVVGWVEYEPARKFDAQAELEANRDTFVKNLKAKLLGTTPIKLGPYPGIEFKAELAGQADIVSRVYAVGQRAYMLAAVTPAGRDASANRERFLSSFQPAAAQ